MSIPASHRSRGLLGAAALGLLASLGCVNNVGGGTVLLVFDQGSNSVLIWNDINKVYNAASAGATIPNADATITGSLLQSRLAWGGMTINVNGGALYLVYENGTVTVIPNAPSQNGALNNTNFIYQFSLGASGERFSNGVFGQASLDPSGSILYAMESTLSGNQSRVWRVPSANTYGSGGTVTPATTFTLDNNGLAQNWTDTYGAGVAAYNTTGTAFGLFGWGNQIWDGNQLAYVNGPRLRLSQSAGWIDPIPGVTSGNVLIGANTGLTQGNGGLTYGSLAYDAQNSLLFMTSQDNDASQNKVVVFQAGQLKQSSVNQAPYRQLGDSQSVLPNLRILSHPPNSDWLLGANFVTAPSGTDTGAGSNTLLIWKSPSGGSPTAVSAALPGVTEIRGMVIGGS